MNTDTLKGKWLQLKGDLKTHWGKLTDDDMQVIDGNIDRLVGKVEELYGETREAVQDRIQLLIKKLRASETKPDETPSPEQPTG